MSFEKWAFFTLSISLLISTPGPMAMLLVQHGIRYGVRQSISTLIGGNVSSIILLALAVLGVGALAISHQRFLDVIKLGGAFYLIYLGIQNFKAEKQEKPSNKEKVDSRLTHIKRFTQGFLVGISNPKDIIFFASFIPQFVDYAGNTQKQIFFLCTTWAVIDLMIMTAYCLSASRLNAGFTTAALILRRVAGVVLVAIGIISLIELTQTYLRMI
jgi:homoserine/homoserine lactone efflux protein